MGNLLLELTCYPFSFLPASWDWRTKARGRNSPERNGRGERRFHFSAAWCPSDTDRSNRRARPIQEPDALDVYNMECLQVESEALDLRMDISPHQRTSSSPISSKTAPPPQIRVLLEERPRPVTDHLDSLIIPTTGASAPLGLMLNPVQSHLDSLVQAEAGAQLPTFCLVTQDLPSMSLNRIKVVAGSAGPLSIGIPSAQSGTKPLPIPAGRLREKRLKEIKEIKEGILQHNQECRDVQERLNCEGQRLHRVAVRYGLSTNLWTVIILMIPILLHETEQVGGFLVYNCLHNQLKTQTINLTAPKDCRDPTTDYHPARTIEIRVILTDGDMPVMATQCLVRKTQEVTRWGGHPSFHYGSVKVAINQPVEVTPQECRDALIAGKISVQGQKMDFKIGASHYHQYYSEGGRTGSGDCIITTFTRIGVTYQKSYEETTIQVLITKVRGLKLDNTIRFPSGLVAPHADGVV
jgi:hypothetical protein